MNKRLIWLFLIVILIAINFPFDYINPRVKYYQIFEFLALFMLLGYFRVLNKFNSGFLYTSFYQIYALVGIAISLVVVGFGKPMIEISQDGNANGAFWVTLLFLILGLESGRIGYILSPKALAEKTKKLSQIFTNRLIYVSTILILVIGFYIFINYSGPLMLGVSRVYFWTNVVPDQFTLYPSLLGQTFFLCVFLYFMRKSKFEKKKAALFIIFLYIISTIFVAGEKFSTFIIYLTATLVLHAGFFEGQRFSPKIILGACFILISLIFFVIFVYLLGGKEIDFVLYRVALQGQLVWSVFNESYLVLLLGDRSGCYFGCGIYDSGNDYISAKYLPPSLFDTYEVMGNRLTGFMPSIPILIFGIPLALILHICVSFLFGLLQRFLVSVISQHDVVSSLLVFKIYFGLLVFWYASRVEPIPGVVVTLIIFIFWFLIFPKRSSDFKIKT